MDTQKLYQSLDSFGGTEAYKLLCLLQELQAEPISTFDLAIDYLRKLDTEYQKAMIVPEIVSQEITDTGAKRTIYNTLPRTPSHIDIPRTRLSKNSALYTDISKLEVGDSLEFSETKSTSRTRMVSVRQWISRQLKDKGFHIKKMGSSLYRIWRIK